MKLKDGFILRKIAGRNVVIPDRENLDLQVMISLNDTGCFLWERLTQGATAQQLAEAMVAEYEVSLEQAREDVAAFSRQLEENGFLA